LDAKVTLLIKLKKGLNLILSVIIKDASPFFFYRWKNMLKEALQAVDVVTFDYPCEFVSSVLHYFYCH